MHLERRFQVRQSREKVAQNLKYDATILARHGLPLAGPCFDTMLASYCSDPSRRSHGLDALALELLGHSMIPYDSLFAAGDKEKDIRRTDLAELAGREKLVDHRPVFLGHLPVCGDLGLETRGIAVLEVVRGQVRKSPILRIATPERQHEQQEERRNTEMPRGSGPGGANRHQATVPSR